MKIKLKITAETILSLAEDLAANENGGLKNFTPETQIFLRDILKIAGEKSATVLCEAEDISQALGDFSKS